MELMPMNQLRVGECGTVEHAEPREELRRRMQDVGLTEGAPVFCVGRSPLGDPAAYRIRDIVIALRDADCAGVLLSVRR